MIRTDTKSMGAPRNVDGSPDRRCDTGHFWPGICGRLSTMTTSTARVLALLEILQAGGIRTVGDLAGRLDVDERTVRRSVKHLSDLGVPVLSIRGRHGG